MWLLSLMHRKYVACHFSVLKLKKKKELAVLPITNKNPFEETV